MTNSDDGFCPLCDVTLDLHDGPNSCHAAEMTADLMAYVWRPFARQP